MFSRLVIIAWLCAPSATRAEQPTHFVFDGGIVDAKRNFVYLTSTGGPAVPAGPVPHQHDGRGEHYAAHQQNAAITALRLDTGEKIWTARDVLVPMHLYRRKLISYARREEEVVLAVVDARNGKLIKLFETGIGIAKPENQGCWPSTHRSSRWWGREKDFWFNHHVSSCPKRRPQGVRLSPDEVQRRAAECTRSDRAVHIDLDNLKLKKSGSAQAPFPHQTGTESRGDLGDLIVRVEEPCAPGTYNCRERSVILKHFRPEGKTLVRKRVLIERTQIQTARLSADGRHVFVDMPPGGETRDLRIFHSRTGKELEKTPVPIPVRFNFTAHLLLKGVLIGTDSGGTSGLRLRDRKPLWHIPRPSVQGPPCPPVP